MDSDHSKYLVGNYASPSIDLVKGKGAWVWDSQNKKYLDFTSGIAVTNIGHCHEHWVKKTFSQAQEMVHCSNLFSIPEQVRLAKRMVKNCSRQNALLQQWCKANEALIKFSRLVGKKREPHRHKLLVREWFSWSNHGCTFRYIIPKYRNGFEPLLEGFLSHL